MRRWKLWQKQNPVGPAPTLGFLPPGPVRPPTTNAPPAPPPAPAGIAGTGASGGGREAAAMKYLETLALAFAAGLGFWSAWLVLEFFVNII